MADESKPPPMPLQMDRDDVERVSAFLALSSRSGSDLDNERLLIEILDCLRAIDDKLGRLLAAGSKAEGNGA